MPLIEEEETMLASLKMTKEIGLIIIVISLRMLIFFLGMPLQLLTALLINRITFVALSFLTL